MAMLEQLTDDWSECKCGEITTLLSIGKNEFFLSCDLCDYRIQNFDLFIKHVHQNHLDVLVEANSMPASTDFLVQHTDEDVSKWHNLVEETDSKDGVLKGFENVEIDIDEGESEATIHYKVEGLAEEYANEYEDHNMQALSETEYLEEDSCEYAIENIEEDASSSDEAHDIETELQDRFKERRFTLEFLKLYRALPSLWNVKNKLYHNREIKREQYQTLLEKYREMYPNAVLRDVKKRINCLRTNYNKERRMLKRGNKQKLYYYKAISFLQDIEPFYKSKAITHDSDDIEMPVVTSDEESEQFEAVEQLKPNMKRCNAERIHAKRKFFLEFIELYKSFPSLWDSSDPDYKNQELRHINYQILLTKYKERYPDAELLDLKKKINCLRTNYKHELSRAINTGVESKAVCFKAMSFLGNNEYNNLETKEIENDIQNTEMASDEAKDDMITEEYLEDCDISEEKAPVEIEIANTQLNSMQNFKEERKSGRFLKEEEKFVLQFIEMYKIMPALWDPNSPGYLDIETKNIHYKILLEKYKERYPLAVLQDVKKKINILRTNYNKELKQITSGVFKKKKSLYFDALSFLQNNESLEPESNSTEKVLNDVNIVEGLIIEDLTQSEEYLENSSTWEDATSTQTQFKNEKSANNAEIEKIYPGELTNEQKFTLEFIEIYQGLPALWDVNSVDYSDREYKNIQYQILLEKYKERYPHANINDVKKKINCLRTNYRRDIRRGPPYALFYFDKMNFLNGIQEPREDLHLEDDESRSQDSLLYSDNKKALAGLRTKPSIRENSCLTDKQFIHLAKAYKNHACLWNTNEMEYRFSNKRREAMDELLKEFNRISRLNLRLDDLKREILKLKMICINEKKLRIRSKHLRIPLQSEFQYYKHIEYLVSHVSPYDCPVCNKIVKGSSQFQIHLASHDGSYPFKCHVCGHGFKKTNNLTVHLRRHVQDYLYKCEICSKPYPTTTDLKIHMRNHTGEKPYVCDICGKNFKLNFEFKEHLKRHGKRPQHKCELCQLAFYNRSLLGEHMKTHQDTRDQICGVCHKGFKTRRTLLTHIRGQHLEKKFDCEMCEKSFAQSTGLKVHMRIHGVTMEYNGAEQDDFVFK
ncbi:uncharacterized protein [Eurosta solidaginis]|uniref:uncharacterized protein isoform X5 n=1 Tax=Eurosta solidaginis TaxID=178769 RepID=UPI003530889D